MSCSEHIILLCAYNYIPRLFWYPVVAMVIVQVVAAIPSSANQVALSGQAVQVVAGSQYSEVNHALIVLTQ